MDYEIEQIDTSVYTPIYDAQMAYGASNYSPVSDGVAARLAVTDEAAISTLQAGGWQATGVCFYQSENLIGAYAGYVFNEPIRLAKVKLWLNRYSGQNLTLYASVEYLDSQNNWVDVNDGSCDITTNMSYPSYVFEKDLDPEVDAYGVRWIHKEQPIKSDSNNITFCGMTVYRAIIPPTPPSSDYTNPDLTRTIYDDSTTTYSVAIYGTDSYRSKKDTPYEGSDTTEIP